MKDVIIDTLKDSVKLLPFLFIAFFLIELIEHRYNKKTKEFITKSGKFGPLFGSLLGLFPQCGFSVMATNLYTTRIITLGTLIAIYLSTSDEMLPIMLASNASFTSILNILLVKFVVGFIWGFVIDFIYKKKNNKPSYDICEEEHCHCDEGIFFSALKHTLSTTVYILIATFLLNTVIYYVGEENISKVFMENSIISFFASSLIGLIPNCAASIIITELYLAGAISFGCAVSGLLTGSGVAILLLFKSNKNIKENLIILSLVYGIGVITGFIIEFVTKLV